MTRIKICGIMTPEELSEAISAGTDAVGFVVQIDDSRHCLSASQAADLIKKVPLFTKSVAVIAPEDVDEAEELAMQTGADILQIHGSLKADDLRELKSRVAQKLVASVAAGSDATGTGGSAPAARSPRRSW